MPTAKDWLILIQHHARHNNLDPLLVEAIVHIESGGNPWLTRYEPNYRWTVYVRDLAVKHGVSVNTMTIMQQTSWGLMQLMGATAYDMGFEGYITELVTPTLGIEWGCKYLAKQRDRFGSYEPDFVAAYNAGRPKKTEGGFYMNQQYVDKVYKKLSELREIK